MQRRPPATGVCGRRGTSKKRTALVNENNSYENTHFLPPSGGFLFLGDMGELGGCEEKLLFLRKI